MMRVFGSVAIGGTKCSVAVARVHDDDIDWIGRRMFATRAEPDEVLAQLVAQLDEVVREAADVQLVSIGIVCGGPLDESEGLVLSPPNLLRWNRTNARAPFEEHFGVPVRLMNDANAGVVAEWMWGAARGATDAAFLTMGTGLGAGLIVNGQLHRGASGLAGEIGHWRLADSGPYGYGKDGSFEGFCSGSGIAKSAQQVALRHLQEGKPSELSSDWFDLADINAHQLAKAADDGDEVALQLWRDVGRWLGVGLALLIDVLNPDVIVLGGIFYRQHDRLEVTMRQELEREALSEALSVCQIIPSELGEWIGDYSGLVAALIGDETTASGRQLTRVVAPDRPRDGGLGDSTGAGALRADTGSFRGK
jgi:glucokinase